MLNISYVAGFFDGEGCVGTRRSGHPPHYGWTAHAQITQNCSAQADELLLEIKGEWGGSLTLMNRERSRVAWNWQVSGRKALTFLQDIRPHLRLKAEQAELAIVWQANRPVLVRDERGRRISLSAERKAIDQRVSDMLAAMKRGAVPLRDLEDLTGEILRTDIDTPGFRDWTEGPKTHCVRGHSFAVPNGYQIPNGALQCRACAKASRHVRTGKIHEDERKKYADLFYVEIMETAA